MRTEFIDGLVALAEADPRIVLIVGDLGYSVIEPFQARFPKRFFNAGIAEQSMMGMAAGMASQGLRPFVYSIANFPTFRCAEQLRNDVAYHGLPVTTVSVGGGMVYGNMGYSHHAIQDYSLMRALPGMNILAPGDGPEVQPCLDFALASSGPSFLRLGNPATGAVRTSSKPLELGRWDFALGDPEAPNVLLTTGATLELAAEWLLTPKYENFQVRSVPAWGMNARSTQVSQFAQFDRVVTLEDHLLDGGFGSWLLESLAIEAPSLVSRLEIRALDASVTRHVAKEAQLRVIGGLIP